MTMERDEFIFWGGLFVGLALLATIVPGRQTVRTPFLEYTA